MRSYSTTMTVSCAPFKASFQARRDPDHPLLRAARAALEERAQDLRTAHARVFSCFELQKTHDLGALTRTAYESLPEDSLFLGLLACEESLKELRVCLLDAETALKGNACARVAPMRTQDEVYTAFKQAGFAHIVTDFERLTLVYEDFFALVRELRALGLSRSFSARSSDAFASRALFAQANALYAARFPAPTGGVIATIDLLYVHGWTTKKGS